MVAFPSNSLSANEYKKTKHCISTMIIWNTYREYCFIASSNYSMLLYNIHGNTEFLYLSLKHQNKELDAYSFTSTDIVFKSFDSCLY